MDLTLIVIIVISALISLRRGFMEEAISLAVWILAGVMVGLFSGILAAHMTPYVERPLFRLLLAGILIFVVTLLLGGGLKMLIGHLVDLTGLSGTDRFMGMIFGAARGALVAVLVVGLLSVTPLKDDPKWKQSILVPQFVMVADWAKALALKNAKNMLDNASQQGASPLSLSGAASAKAE